MMNPVGRRLILMTWRTAHSAGAATVAAAPIRREIVLSCPQYRPGGQDVASDQALRANPIALTPRCIVDCCAAHQRAASRKRRASLVPVTGEAKRCSD
jgi:hypothetical protein